MIIRKNGFNSSTCVAHYNVIIVLEKKSVSLLQTITLEVVNLMDYFSRRMQLLL